mmetsp:Transcript_52770/g.146493  ORF Transcript_52770/g.146493 Transcript_52770/m.146493 type:complete len:218 (+) Transcript_52770:358-1011(+)
MGRLSPAGDVRRAVVRGSIGRSISPHCSSGAGPGPRRRARARAFIARAVSPATANGSLQAARAFDITAVPPKPGVSKRPWAFFALWDLFLCLDEALLLEQLRQIATLEFRCDDVAPTHELAVNVELRDSGPVAVLFDALTNLLVLEHVDAAEVHTDRMHDPHHLLREATLRGRRGALHVEQHRVRLDVLVDQRQHLILVAHVGHGLALGLEIIVAVV